MSNYPKLYYKLFKKKGFLKRLYFSKYLNAFRRIICPLIIRVKYNKKSSLKLHLGCGKVNLKGYINIDIRKTEATDYVCDVINLPFTKESVELIETYHMIEHLSKKDFIKVLINWREILVPGGKLIMELPDFDKVVKEYLQGNESRINNIFGLQRYKGDAHLYGYNFKRLKKILKQNGYGKITNPEPMDYHKKNEPCLRVEAYKVINKKNSMIVCFRL